MSKIQKLVEKGTNLREKARHEQALEVLDEALRLALRSRDLEGTAAALASRCLTWKHFYQLTGDKAYLYLAQSDASSGFAIVKAKKLKSLHSAFFRVAEIAVLAGDYEDAVSNYKWALRFYRGSHAEKGDYRYHYGQALYLAGRKQAGLRELKGGLRDIQTYRGEVSTFLANVWESGANMRLSELLWKSDGKEAEKHLTTAEKIIMGDKRLVMRRKQLAILRKKLKNSIFLQ